MSASASACAATLVRSFGTIVSRSAFGMRRVEADTGAEVLGRTGANRFRPRRRCGRSRRLHFFLRADRNESWIPVCSADERESPAAAARRIKRCRSRRHGGGATTGAEAARPRLAHSAKSSCGGRNRCRPAIGEATGARRILQRARLSADSPESPSGAAAKSPAQFDSRAGWTLRRKMNAPISRLLVREFHFHVALHIRKRAHLDHAANRVLARFQIRHHQHLARGYCRGHSQHAAVWKHDHRAGFFLERFGVRSDSARDFRDARAMNFYGDFERESIGAQMSATRGCRFRRSAGLRVGAAVAEFATSTESLLVAP